MKKMRARSAAGVAGPVVFTGAWIGGSLLQPGHLQRVAVTMPLAAMAAMAARLVWRVRC